MKLILMFYCTRVVLSRDSNTQSRQSVGSFAKPKVRTCPSCDTYHVSVSCPIAKVAEDSNIQSYPSQDSISHNRSVGTLLAIDPRSVGTFLDNR